MAAKLAFVFPGQGSQQVGMLRDLAERYSVVRSTFDEASAAVGYDLWAKVQEGSAEEINATIVTQPALLTASVAIWRVWQELEGVRPEVMAGHSLGEYSALVCAGALSFADGVRLVKLRAEVMQNAMPEGEGAMAAILGLSDEQVEAACHNAAQGAVVSAVNYNSPGQVVIAGERDAVARAIELCREAGAKRALPLPVSVPSHCELMRPAAKKLAEALAEIEIKTPRYPVVQNVDAQAHSDPQVLRERLVEQLYRPVRWSDCVKNIVATSTTLFVECGPGKVLTNLDKRIDRQIVGLAVNDPDSLATALERVNEENSVSETTDVE